MTTYTIAQVPPYLPANGLVAWYPFNGNANDESGNGNNGIVYGATLTADRFSILNSAYDYNGINNYIYVTGNSSLNSIVDTFSCSIWIYGPPFTSVTQTETAISKTEISSSYFGFKNWIYNNQLEFRVINGLGAAGIYTIGPVVNSSWHNIVSIVSNTARTLYVDGLLNNTIATGGSTYGLNSGPLTIGASMLSSGIPFSWFLGKIDDVAIWNRPLSSQEITNIYNSTVGLFELSDKNEINIFPNPAHDRINIETIKNYNGSTYIIKDLLGKKVLSGKLNPLNTTVDIAGLDEGVYIFSIGNNSIQSFSIVKN